MFASCHYSLTETRDCCSGDQHASVLVLVMGWICDQGFASLAEDKATYLLMLC